jgi:antitoxin component YwqK of YwqJK toxin-antitoxin module
MNRNHLLLPLLLLGSGTILRAQDLPLLASDAFDLTDGSSGDLVIDDYERLNGVLGGDSLRLCHGVPCTGWVEDRYAEGGLKHRGYYDRGRLTVYKNYHPNGAMEREFRSIDVRKSILRTFHADSSPRSLARYVDGVAVEYQDHYANGRLRYHEEKHRTEPYYLRMDLYAPNGDPISLLRIVDKKRLEFEVKEYHPGGVVREEGRAQYNRSRMDTQRIGTWRSYAVDGTLLREEDLVDGRVQQPR